MLLLKRSRLEEKNVLDSVAQMRCDKCQPNPETCCVGIFIHPSYIMTTAYCAESCGRITSKNKQVHIRKKYIFSKNSRQLLQPNTTLLKNAIALIKVRRNTQRAILKLSAVDISAAIGSPAFVPVPVLGNKNFIRGSVYIERCPNNVYKETQFVCGESRYHRRPKPCLQTQGLPLLLDNRIIGITGTADESMCYTEAPHIFLAIRSAIKPIYTIIIQSNNSKQNKFTDKIRRNNDVSNVTIIIKNKTNSEHIIMIQSQFEENIKITNKSFSFTAVTAKNKKKFAITTMKRPSNLVSSLNTTMTMVSSSLPIPEKTTLIRSSVFQHGAINETSPPSAKYILSQTSQSTTNRELSSVATRLWETAITAKKRATSLTTTDISAVPLLLTPLVGITKNGAEVNTTTSSTLLNVSSMNSNNTSILPVLPDDVVRLVTIPTKKKNESVEMESTKSNKNSSLVSAHSTNISMATNDSRNYKSHTNSSSFITSTYNSAISTTLLTPAFTFSTTQRLKTNSTFSMASTEKQNKVPQFTSITIPKKKRRYLNRVADAMSSLRAAMKTNKKIRNFIVQISSTDAPIGEFMDMT